MDIKQIKSLVQLMVENDLSRVELSEGETHILLRRGQPTAVGPVSPHLGAIPSPVPLPAPGGAAGSQPPVAENNDQFIRSPMVGTFYASPDPESPAFATVGDEISPDTVICLVEAMKVFNEIKAEVSGRITKVLVKNAEAVEFDQPLFAIAPA